MSLRLGCALPFDLFLKEPSAETQEIARAFGGKDALLDFCAERLDTIELRAVRAHHTPGEVLSAVRCAESYGLGVTIHATLAEAEVFFPPYAALIAEAKPGERYNLTVHPAGTAEETARILRGLCAEIEKKGYPLFLTLENQRIKRDNPRTFGLAEEVRAIAEEIDSPVLGLCFDFGHQLANERKYDNDPVTAAFFGGVRHTHIHALREGITHFPLPFGETRLERNLTGLLCAGYAGTLSLELEPKRYGGAFDLKEAYAKSISILRLAVSQVEAKLAAAEFAKSRYADMLAPLCRDFHAAERCVALLGASGYIIKLGETRIAVDLAPTRMQIGKRATEMLRELVSGFDAVLLTHAHGDHYDGAFLAALPDRLPKYAPDFMAHSCPGAIPVSSGETVRIGEITLDFFESGHFHCGLGVPELGFCITHGGERLLFPADVRDYNFSFPSFGKMRALFAHLWFGRGEALNLYDNPYVEAFARFAEQFGASEIYLAHLDEFGRTIEDMWSDAHVAALSERLPAARAFHIGDLVRL